MISKSYFFDLISAGELNVLLLLIPKYVFDKIC